MDYKVSVSLRSIVHSYYEDYEYYSRTILQFPSPYGVSFILMWMKDYMKILKLIKRVSVSLRSIVHSYFTKCISYNAVASAGFRLLTEYRSFLLDNEYLSEVFREIVSVSLRSIVHSYL